MQLPVAVRNTQAGPTVFTDHVSKETVNWDGAGEPGDVQIVTESILNNANFIRAVQAGIFEIEDLDDNEELKARLDRFLNAPGLAEKRAKAIEKRKKSLPKTVPGETMIAPDKDGTLVTTTKDVKVVVEKRQRAAEVDEDWA